MAYKTLTDNQQDEILVSTLAAQEVDLFSHETSITRYETMLKTLPEGKFRIRIENLLKETKSRRDEVQAIIDATIPQLPSDQRVMSAVGRLIDKGHIAL